MTLPSLPQWLTTAASAAGGAALGYLSQHPPSNPASATDWKPVVLGALGAAGVALWHLYQTRPGATAVAK